MNKFLTVLITAAAMVIYMGYCQDETAMASKNAPQVQSAQASVTAGSQTR